MNLSRRLFLGGAIALAGAAIIPAQAMPRIVGDGVHDDADGLNALIAGDPVHIENARLAVAADGRIWFNEGGRFLIGKSLRVMRDNATIDGGVFIASPDLQVPMILLGAQACLLKNGRLIGNGGVGVRVSRQLEARPLTWQEWNEGP